MNLIDSLSYYSSVDSFIRIMCKNEQQYIPYTDLKNNENEEFTLVSA